MLSKRLKMVGNQIPQSEFLADIGTDHGYLPIFLCRNNIVKRAIASDVSPGSAQKALDNVTRHGLNDRITVRCGNGLEVINKGEKPDTILISGMGGLLTIEILENSREVVNYANTLVLQPQRDNDKVREYIHSIGFKIENEEMIKEQGKFYNVILCVRGKDTQYSPNEYLCSKILIENKSPVLKEYLTEEVNKIERITENIKKDEDKVTLLELKAHYEEVLQCLWN